MRAVHVLALLGAVFCLGDPAPVDGRTNGYRPIDCSRADERLSCGTVLVPAGGQAGDNQMFQIAVARVRAKEPRAGNVPILVLHGGPGGALVDQPQPWLNSPLSRHHDLILVDQRGGGRSRETVCPQLVDRHIRVLAGDYRPDEEARLRAAANRACYQSLRGSPHGPEAFGTSEVAADMEAIRHALGIDRWNIYGVSYGTTVAMTMMKRSPQAIRSAILDSPYPPDPQGLSERGNFLRAMNVLFAACARSEECSAEFPRLREEFVEALAKLRALPLSIPAEHPLFPEGGFVMNASDFATMIFQLLYSREFSAIVPHLIRAVREGKAERLAPLVEMMFTQMREFNFGAHLAIECRDRPRFRSVPLAVPNGTPDWLRDFNFFEGHYEACRSWGTAGPAPLSPQGSTIPTLILSGSMDPVTPPLNGMRLHALLPASQFITLNWVGHGVVRSDPCAADIATEFIRNPRQDLNGRCAEASSLPPFVGGVTYVPGLARALGRLGRGEATAGAAIFLGSTVAALLFLLWQLGRFIRRRFRRAASPVPADVPSVDMPAAPGRRPDRFLRAANLLVLVNTAALAGAIVWTAVNQPPTLALGLPSAAIPLFALPWAILLLTVAGAFSARRGASAQMVAGGLIPVFFVLSALALGVAGI